MPRPDEGLIHAWLDGQLPPDEAVRVEQMVATDAEWAEAVAEARGLIAASSRILSALDHVPAGVVPERPAARAPRRLPWWTKAAAAVVLMAGASTLLLRRTPAPEIAKVQEIAREHEIPRAPEIARVPEIAPAAPVVTKKEVSARRPISGGVAAAASGAVPNAPVSLPALDVPAPSLAVQQGVVTDQQAKVAVAPAQALQRQRMDETRQGAMQVLAQRTAAEQGAAKAFAARAAARAPSANVVGEMAPERRATFAARPGACYQLRDSRTSAEVGTVMRIGRMGGDTLLLESVQATSPLRAWVVMRGDTARGVLTTEPEARGMVLVTALPVPCPVP